MVNKEKHMPYYKLLAALEKARDCVLCELGAGYLHRYFENLLYENVNDPGLRKKLTRSGGFCHRHAHLLLTVGDALGTAILYKDLVGLFSRELDRMKTGQIKSLHKELQGRSACLDCPACLSEKEHRRNQIGTFLEWLEDEELKRKFEAGPGFCKEHLFAVLEQADNQKVCTYLIETHGRKYALLLADLEEFIRKNDYRFIKEKVGPEGSSWLRAVKMLTGVKEVF